MKPPFLIPDYQALLDRNTGHSWGYSAQASLWKREYSMPNRVFHPTFLRDGLQIWEAVYLPGSKILIGVGYYVSVYEVTEQGSRGPPHFAAGVLLNGYEPDLFLF